MFSFIRSKWTWWLIAPGDYSNLCLILILGLYGKRPDQGVIAVHQKQERQAQFFIFNEFGSIVDEIDYPKSERQSTGILTRWMYI